MRVQPARRLAGRPAAVLTDQLLEASRVYDNEVYDRSIDVQVPGCARRLNRIRSQPRFIVTERGVLYVQLCGPSPVLNVPRVAKGITAQKPASSAKQRVTSPVTRPPDCALHRRCRGARGPRSFPCLAGSSAAWAPRQWLDCQARRCRRLAIEMPRGRGNACARPAAHLPAIDNEARYCVVSLPDRL